MVCKDLIEITREHPRKRVGVGKGGEVVQRLIRELRLGLAYIAVNSQLKEGFEALTCTKVWIACSITDRISRLVSLSFHRTHMPPLKPTASDRQTLSKLREELMSLALCPEIWVSIMTAMARR